MRSKKYIVLGRVFIGLMLALMYFPILILIIFSFSGNKGMGAWTNFNFTFDLYALFVTDEAILAAVGNTFLIAIISSTLATVIGTISAIGMFYLHRKARSVVGILNQITVINADIVTAVAFMLFFIVCMNYLDGYPALIIGHTMITVPYVILSVTPRLSQLNPNLYEAGRDLGAGPMRAISTVMIPQLVPGIISGFIMAFTLSLDDFVITLFNKGSGIDTISTLVYTATRKGVDPSFRALSAVIFIVVLAALVVMNVTAAARRKKLERAGGIGL